MSILITGSSGTIGTRLCEQILKENMNIVGCDWKENKWVKTVNDSTILLDLRNDTELKKLPKNIDTIIHLAANARVYELVEHPDRARDNFLTTFNILEFARKHNIRRFLFASSRECYGNAGKKMYTEEDAKFRTCESPYTASKIGGEALIEAYKRCYGIDAIIFRFSNVYGMYDDSIRVVPLFIRQARAGKPLTVYGRQKYLDFTYIDDTVDGIILALKKFDDAKNDTYNIAYGEGTSILDLAELVKKIIGSRSDIMSEESRTGEIVQFVADISKARKRLGYNPQVSLQNGIKKAIEWYSTHM